MAASHAQAAVAATVEAGHRLLEADAYLVLAGVYTSRGLRDRARTYAARTLAMHREAGHRTGEERAALILDQGG